MKDLLNSRVFGGEGTWTSVSGGTVNDVWLVKHSAQEPAIVRIGPSASAVAVGPSWMRGSALACEAIVLDRLQGMLLHLPTPLAAGFRPGAAPWLIQKLVPGVPFSEGAVLMSPRDRLDIWRQLGLLLRRLHDLGMPWFGTPDGRQRFSDWFSMMNADARGLLDDARRFRIDKAPFRDLQEEIETSAAVLADITTPALVHSDLDPRHVFVQQGIDGWEISGVIDWEYARYADPMSESIVVAVLARPAGDPEREAFLAGYALDVARLGDPAFWQRQRIYRGIALGWERTDAARLAAMITAQDVT